MTTMIQSIFALICLAIFTSVVTSSVGVFQALPFFGLMTMFTIIMAACKYTFGGEE